MLVEIAEIKIGDRVRKDFGDLDALAKSISEHGLIQPIAVTSDMELIDGERRLRALRDVLRLAEIEASIMDIEAIAFGEHDANVLRENFKPSERVKIGEKIEAAIRKRQGMRTDQLVEAPPQVEKGRKTRDLVADKAGFSSHVTRDGAARVVESGIPELAAMMDAGEVSITAAGELARAPEDVQIKAVSEGPEAVKAEAKRSMRERREAKKAESDPEKGKSVRSGKSSSPPSTNRPSQIRSLPALGTDGRPVALNRFYLSLRSIYDTLVEMDKSAPEFLDYAADNRTFLDHEVVSHVADFLSDIVELWEADRAA